MEQVANENLANRKRHVRKFAARDVLQTHGVPSNAPPSHSKLPQVKVPSMKLHLQTAGGQAEDIGGLEGCQGAIGQISLLL